MHMEMEEDKTKKVVRDLIVKTPAGCRAFNFISEKDMISEF